MKTKQQKLADRNNTIYGIVQDAMRMGAAIGHWATDEKKTRARAGGEAMVAAEKVFFDELVAAADIPCTEDDEV